MVSRSVDYDHIWIGMVETQGGQQWSLLKIAACAVFFVSQVVLFHNVIAINTVVHQPSSGLVRFRAHGDSHDSTSFLFAGDNATVAPQVKELAQSITPQATTTTAAPSKLARSITPQATTTTAAPPKPDVSFGYLFGVSPLSSKIKYASSVRGIIMCMHSALVPIGASLIRELRDSGATEPIQVFYCLENELSESAKAAILAADPQVEIIDLCRYLIQVNLFPDEMHARQFQNFWLKPLALVVSPFAEVMLLDVDNIFVQNPSRLWLSRAYRETGTLFFHDRVLDFSQFLNQDVGIDRTYIQDFFDSFPYSHLNLDRPKGPSTTMNASMVWNKHTAHEQDSSVVLMDKARAGTNVLRVLWYLVAHKRFLDPITYSWGDKEAFWIAYELSQVPYQFTSWNCGVVSEPNDIALHPTTLCGSLAQFSPDEGNATLFYVNGNAIINVYRRGDGHGTNWSERAKNLLDALPQYVTPRHKRRPTTQNRMDLDQTCLIDEGTERIDPEFLRVATKRIENAKLVAESITW
ncbi:unnamed protein product [Aphanomyces euteiches]